MKEKSVHHLPVADERGMIVGMISANDIFAAIEEMGWAALYARCHRKRAWWSSLPGSFFSFQSCKKTRSLICIIDYVKDFT